MGENIYTAYWKSVLPAIIAQFQHGKTNIQLAVKELANYGDRERGYYSSFKIVNGILEHPRNAKATGRDLYEVLSQEIYFKENLLQSTIYVTITKDLQLKMETINNNTPEFFSEEDFVHLAKFSKQKRDVSNAEHNDTYEYLRETYDKIKYWSEQVQQTVFPNGSVHVIRKPTNQANRFEEYQWAKIYPDAEAAQEEILAYTVGIATDNNFHIKIDTVGLPETDPRRSIYIECRGDFYHSDIVKLLPYQQVVDKSWKYLIDSTANIITDFKPKYDELYNKILNTDNKPTNQPDNKMTLPLNSIFYGPPGTGKTYHTIDRAIEIVDNKFYNENKTNREKLKQRFNELLIQDFDKSEGQIAFCTFHQSMSYEDFIEGIKPLKPEEGKALQYDIEDGIFKLLSKKAQSNFENAKKENKQKLSFEDAFQKLKDEWEENRDMKFPLKTEGYEYTILAFTNTSIQFKKASGGTSHTLSINTLREQYYGKEYNFKQGVGIYYPGILQKLRSYEKDNKRAIEQRNYVLIIDEINRGNIAQIFGELITLIEEDKRAGKDESLSIILPYSKETFSVPLNLYIIGTMNTADRSVEVLDTALRRRFVFEEMMPEAELLSPKSMIVRMLNTPESWNSEWDEEPYRTLADGLYELLGIDASIEDKLELMTDDVEEAWTNKELDFLNDKDFKGINLQKLLESINNRLSALLTKDHTIGHAWLMNVDSLEELRNAFKNKIIPLLQEYFYNNYAKIGLVLGNSFVEKSNTINASVFAKFDNKEELAEDYNEKIIYTMIDCSELELKDFKSIYE